MIQRYNKILILFLLVLAGSNAFAQQIKGVVTDSVTHEPLMYISVYYQEKRDMQSNPLQRLLPGLERSNDGISYDATY
jgi:hypothetical protein